MLFGCPVIGFLAVSDTPLLVVYQASCFVNPNALVCHLSFCAALGAHFQVVGCSANNTTAVFTLLSRDMVVLKPATRLAHFVAGNLTLGPRELAQAHARNGRQEPALSWHFQAPESQASDVYSDQ